MKGRGVSKWILTASLTGLCSGCGPVNIKTMTPSVWKPSALFVLDGRLPTWRPSVAQSLGDESSVVTKAVYVPSGQVETTLNRTLRKMPGVSLYVVLSNQGFSKPMELWARHHVTIRLEWVAPSGELNAPLVNVRQLVQSPTPVGYLVGWLAARVATRIGQSTIGWDLAQTGAPQSAILASFGGAYAASPTINPVRVSLNELALNGISNTLNQLPKAIIVNHSLSASALALANANHIIVFSMVAQSGDPNPVAAAPSIPTQKAVLSELVKLRRAVWKSGIVYEDSPNPLIINSQWVTPSDERALQTQEELIHSDKTWADSAWNFIPNATRQLWGNLVTP